MKGFKTIALGVLIAGVAALSSPEMQAYVAEHFEAAGATIGFLVVLMRAFTNSPMVQDGPVAPTDSE